MRCNAILPKIQPAMIEPISQGLRRRLGTPVNAKCSASRATPAHTTARSVHPSPHMRAPPVTGSADPSSASPPCYSHESLARSLDRCGCMQAEPMQQIQRQFDRQAAQYSVSLSHSTGETLDALRRFVEPGPYERGLDVVTGAGFAAFAI